MKMECVRQFEVLKPKLIKGKVYKNRNPRAAALKATNAYNRKVTNKAGILKGITIELKEQGSGKIFKYKGKVTALSKEEIASFVSKQRRFVPKFKASVKSMKTK